MSETISTRVRLAIVALLRWSAGHAWNPSTAVIIQLTRFSVIKGTEEQAREAIDLLTESVGESVFDLTPQEWEHGVTTENIRAVRDEMADVLDEIGLKAMKEILLGAAGVMGGMVDWTDPPETLFPESDLPSKDV